MSARIVKLADATPQRWRNGGGITRELLAWPPRPDWRVRVSVADIDRDGPFSNFPGVERWFAVLDGAGVELVIDGVPQRVARGAPPLSFRGDAQVACRLSDGPTRDVNLMLRQASGGMYALLPARAWRPRAACCGLFAATAGACIVGATRIDVDACSLVWFEHAPAELAFAGPGRDAAGWWLAATPQKGAA